MTTVRASVSGKVAFAGWLKQRVNTAGITQESSPTVLTALSPLYRR